MQFEKMDSARLSSQTWKSVISDHLKDKDLKTLYAHFESYETAPFPVIPSWDLLKCVPSTPENDPISGLSLNTVSMCCLMHWALVRQRYSDEIRSKILKMVAIKKRDKILCYLIMQLASLLTIFSLVILLH